MAGHLTNHAVAVKQALESSAGLDDAVRTLYAELGAFDVARAIDVGAGGLLLVCRPGLGPLDDPSDFVSLATLVR